LEVRKRDRVPLLWAATQNDLSDALRRLGEREDGTARLEEAVAAYRLALQERTRDRVPFDWAVTQKGLGDSLRRLGEREGGTTQLQEALAAYDSAIAIFSATGADYYASVCRNNRDEVNALMAQRH
jgi:tetratricopeptide (TPR) repeat protein